MQQNIVSLKKCPSVFKNRARFFPSILVFNIQLFCSFFLFFNILEEHVRSRTLKAAQTVSNLFSRLRTCRKKKTLRSFNSNQCRNNPWSYWFLFFFLLVFFFLFKDFIQCHLYTTKSPIYYYISFFFFCFLKKEPHGAPQYCGSRRKK